MIMNKPVDLYRRAPVWEVLAELFVGRELQDYDYKAIAKVLKDSGFSIDELDNMLKTEVGPIFRRNLSPMAVPEMEAWSREYVVEAVCAYLEKGKQTGLMGLVNRLTAIRSLPGLTAERWVKVQGVLK
jgi:hypothetical protein